MDLFEKTCLAIVTICAGTLLLEGALFIREARIDADKITGQIVGLTLPTKNAEAAIAAAALTFAQVGAHERDAFQEQQNYFRGLSARTNTLLDSATTSVQFFNNSVLPRVATALDGTAGLETSAAQDLTDTTTKIDGTIDALRPVITNAISATAAASAAMSDPAIHDSLVHVDGTAGNLDAASRDFAAYVHRMTAPARGVWNALKTLLGLAAQARQAGGI